MSTAFAIAAVVGTGASLVASSKAASLQKESNAVQNAAQKTEDASRLRKQAREARIQRARILQAGEATGSTGGSRESGSISSLSTQLGANTSRVSGQANTSNALTDINNSLASNSVTKAFADTTASIGVAGFEKTGGFDNLFKGS